MYFQYNDLQHILNAVVCSALTESRSTVHLNLGDVLEDPCGGKVALMGISHGTNEQTWSLTQYT